MDTEANTIFPGRPDYTGPRTGWFGLLHHEILCEKSHDVMERVDYVRRNKPKNEVATRLHNMIYLGGCEAAMKLAPLDADCAAKRAVLDADYAAKLAPLDADYWAKRAVLDADYWAKRAVLDADYEAKRAVLDADYWAKRAVLNADYWAKRAVLDADYEAKLAPLDAEILTYIRQHIPDCAWNGITLVFPKA